MRCGSSGEHFIYEKAQFEGLRRTPNGGKQVTFGPRRYSLPDERRQLLTGDGGRQGCTKVKIDDREAPSITSIKIRDEHGAIKAQRLVVGVGWLRGLHRMLEGWYETVAHLACRK